MACMIPASKCLHPWKVCKPIAGRKFPLSPEFFSQKCTCICVHSAHATFAGVPLPQPLLLWGQTWLNRCTWRAPLAIPLMTFMTTQEPSNGGHEPMTSPKLGLDLSSGTSHLITVHVFLKTWVPNVWLRPSEWPMNITKPNTLTPSPNPSTPRLHLVRGVGWKADQIFRFWPKCGPMPSKPYMAITLLIRIRSECHL